MKPDIDFEEQRIRIDKMIIDMEHDVKKRMNWQAQQDDRGERAKAQDRQWKAQRLTWIIAGIVSVVALIVNAYIQTH